MMLYHAGQFAGQHEQAAQARAFVDFLARGVVEEPGSVYAASIHGAVEAMRQRTDGYLIHEYLEEYNEPLYFHEFVARVRAAGLHYLTDARPWAAAAGLRPEVAAAVAQ